MMADVVDQNENGENSEKGTDQNDNIEQTFDTPVDNAKLEKTRDDVFHMLARQILGRLVQNGIFRGHTPLALLENAAFATEFGETSVTQGNEKSAKGHEKNLLTPAGFPNMKYLETLENLRRVGKDLLPYQETLGLVSHQDMPKGDFESVKVRRNDRVDFLTAVSLDEKRKSRINNSSKSPDTTKKIIPDKPTKVTHVREQSQDLGRDLIQFSDNSRDLWQHKFTDAFNSICKDALGDVVSGILEDVNVEGRALGLTEQDLFRGDGLRLIEEKGNMQVEKLYGIDIELYTTFSFPCNLSEVRTCDVPNVS